MTTEIVCVVIEHDGQLCHLAIPEDRKNLALRLLQGLFDDGVLPVVKLPDDWKKVPLKEALAR
jgi:hypothetical protein